MLNANSTVVTCPDADAACHLLCHSIDKAALTSLDLCRCCSKALLLTALTTTVAPG